MIRVEKRGRLGNQLFQYAFALAAARRLGTGFLYETDELARYFVLGNENGRRLHLPILRRREYVADDCDDPGQVLEELTDHTRYGGFFYAPGYFEPAAALVREHLTVHPWVEDAFRRAYGHLLERGYTCAHVRLTDFATYRDDVRLPPGYYCRALDRVAEPVVFVSDDIETVRKHFGDVPGARFEGHEEILDFLLIRHARTVITSNSAFSWWAAWLNESAEVIAPALWLGVNVGEEFPPGTIPPHWRQIAARVDGEGSGDDPAMGPVQG